MTRRSFSTVLERTRKKVPVRHLSCTKTVLKMFLHLPAGLRNGLMRAIRWKNRKSSSTVGILPTAKLIIAKQSGFAQGSAWRFLVPISRHAAQIYKVAQCATFRRSPSHPNGEIGF